MDGENTKMVFSRKWAEMVCYIIIVGGEHPFISLKSICLFNGPTDFLNRFCIIIFGACVSIGYGVRGTMQRGAYPTFKSVLLMDFGAPDPTSFTAYFLPRSVCLLPH